MECKITVAWRVSKNGNFFVTHTLGIKCCFPILIIKTYPVTLQQDERGREREGEKGW